MITLAASDGSLLLRFSSDITLVDYGVDIIDSVLAHGGLAERTAVLVVSREPLENAVVPGNRNETEKMVTLRLERLSEARYGVEAEDGGAGFDVASVTRCPALAEPGGGPNGFALLRALAARPDFNETGNRVTAYVDALAYAAL